MINYIKIITPIMFVVCCLFLVWPGGDSVELKYKLYDDIPDNSGVTSWLPLFFPKSSVDINFYSNLDTDYFYVIFDLKEKDLDVFEKQFTIKATKEGRGRLNNIGGVSESWCQLNPSVMNRDSNNLYLIGKLAKNKYVVTSFFSVTSKNDHEYKIYCMSQ